MTNMRRAAAAAVCGMALAGTALLTGPASAGTPDQAPNARPGAVQKPAEQWITEYVWATNVNVRDETSGPNCYHYPSIANCPGIVRTVSKENITVTCQKRGQLITDSGYSSEWWSYTLNGSYRPSGWTSNVYIRGNAHLDGVPDCAWS